MTIFQIECYYALSRSLNFTQTANQQFITQPALSRSISALESELGLKLINRTTHKVTLTPAGEVFAEECRKIIAAYQTGVQNAQYASEKLIGRIRFGLPSDSFEPIAVRLVQELKRQHSGIQVEFKFSTPSPLVRMLDDSLVDMIVASGKPRYEKSHQMLIEQRKEYIVVPCDHPLAGREEVDISELRTENFIALSRASSAAGYESILSHADNSGFTPNIIAEADTVSALLMQVACGVGITILYKEHQPAYSAPYLSFVPLKSAKPFDRYLIWNQNDNPCLDAVITTAKALFRTGMD